MTTPKRRQKLVVEPNLQGTFIRRVVFQCSCFIVLSFLLAVATPFLVEHAHKPVPEIVVAFGDTITSLPSLMVQFATTYGIMLLVGIILIPVFCFDMVELSNRFAGPMMRMRRGLIDLVNGKEMEPIKLREMDFGGDIASNINRLAEQIKLLKEASDERRWGPIIRELAERRQARKTALAPAPAPQKKSFRSFAVKLSFGLVLGSIAGFSGVYFMHVRPQHVIGELQAEKKGLTVRLEAAESARDRAAESIAQSRTEIEILQRQLMSNQSLELLGETKPAAEPVRPVVDSNETIQPEPADAEALLVGSEDLKKASQQVEAAENQFQKLSRLVEQKQTRLGELEKAFAVASALNEKVTQEAATQHDRLKKLVGDLDGTQQQISRVSSELAEKNRRLSQLNTEVTVGEREAEKTRDRLAKESERLKTVSKKLIATEAQLRELESQLAATEQRLAVSRREASKEYDSQQARSGNQAADLSEMTAKIRRAEASLQDAERKLSAKTAELSLTNQQLAEAEKSLDRTREALQLAPPSTAKQPTLTSSEPGNANTSESNERIAQSHFQRGESQFVADDYAAAVLSLNEAVKLSPRNPGYRYLRGVVHSRLGRPSLAEMDYRVAATLERPYLTPLKKIDRALRSIKGKERDRLDSYRRRMLGNLSVQSQ